MRIAYKQKNFRDSSKLVIVQAIEIITEYMEDELTLSLRQLYYQFVSRDLLPNTLQSYGRLGQIIASARMCGYIDWDAIEDRTRNLDALQHWNTPNGIIRSAVDWYRVDIWDTQPYYIEVWIEKEALSGVFQPICYQYQVPLLSCRGYTSLSEMHTAALRFRKKESEGKTTVILHFGDHDPSGMDMTHDIQRRLHTFASEVEVRRLALNMDQVEEYDPPPNPAKVKDSRFDSYMKQYGTESWELDALEPSVLTALVEQTVEALIEVDAWNKALKRQAADKKKLAKLADEWEG